MASRSVSPHSRATSVLETGVLLVLPVIVVVVVVVVPLIWVHLIAIILSARNILVRVAPSVLSAIIVEGAVVLVRIEPLVLVGHRSRLESIVGLIVGLIPEGLRVQMVRGRAVRGRRSERRSTVGWRRPERRVSVVRRVSVGRVEMVRGRAVRRGPEGRRTVRRRRTEMRVAVRWGPERRWTPVEWRLLSVSVVVVVVVWICLASIWVNGLILVLKFVVHIIIARIPIEQSSHILCHIGYLHSTCIVDHSNQTIGAGLMGKRAIVVTR